MKPSSEQLQFNKLYFLPGLDNPRNLDIPSSVAERIRQVCETDLEFYELNPNRVYFERTYEQGEAWPLEYPAGTRVIVVAPELFEGNLRVFRVFSHYCISEGGGKAGRRHGIPFISDVWNCNNGEHRHEYGVCTDLPAPSERFGGLFGAGSQN